MLLYNQLMIAEFLLADRTNIHAYATVLCLSVAIVCRLWRYILWVNGAS